jgi:hypothetical protein
MKVFKILILLILLTTIAFSTHIFIKNIFVEEGEGYGKAVIVNGKKYVEGDNILLDEECEDCFKLVSITNDGSFIVEYRNLYTSLGFNDPGGCSGSTEETYKTIITEDVCFHTSACDGNWGYCFANFEEVGNYISVDTESYSYDSGI